MRAPKFWTSRSPLATGLAWGLSPLGALYDLGGRVRFATTTPYRPALRVICVGNLTAGGTGKTPVAIALGRRLAAAGAKVGFLTRGFGGALKGPITADPSRHASAETGDEPLLLAQAAPTIVARDRIAGAKLAEAMGLDTLIMDDGFQNPSLVKDLSFVVVDGATGFGNRFVIPAGPLRETVERGLARAQALVIMGDGAAPKTALPILRARLIAEPDSAALVKGGKTAAFAGIGRPEKFFETLRSCGANVVLARPFPDHYAFTSADWSALAGDAAEYGAQLVTTEKDWVRLRPEWRAKCLAFRVTASFEDPHTLDLLLGLHG